MPTSWVWYEKRCNYTFIYFIAFIIYFYSTQTDKTNLYKLISFKTIVFFRNYSCYVIHVWHYLNTFVLCFTTQTNNIMLFPLQKKVKGMCFQLSTKRKCIIHMHPIQAQRQNPRRGHWPLFYIWLFICLAVKHGIEGDPPSLPSTAETQRVHMKAPKPTFCFLWCPTSQHKENNGALQLPEGNIFFKKSEENSVCTAFLNCTLSLDIYLQRLGNCSLSNNPIQSKCMLWSVLIKRHCLIKSTIQYVTTKQQDWYPS